MPENPSLIDASPTKEFFIEMLTRDIELTPAIIDLVDNCVDGARRLKGDGPYKDLFVHLTVAPNKFSVRDNCGGIDLDTATKYAFRFGRPAKMKPTAHSIGQFGVGMKRALFKLGTAFTVESTAERSKFKLTVDVGAWSKEDSWQLPFNGTRSAKAIPAAKRGTTISVDPLHPTVASDFELDTFLSNLREELERAHQRSIDRGLSITLNRTPLHVNLGTLLQSSDIRPARREFSLNGAPDSVDVTIYCGVGDSSPRDAGWYVFCNGRLVMEADQSSATGWGARDGQAIPSYHNQFATFRGYVFMECNDAGRLPWNTTKTGVDADSDVFRAVRREMLQVMRPVIDFLNRLDAENDREEEDGPGPLTVAVAAASATPLSKTQPAEAFTWPTIKPQSKPSGPKTGRIQYDKPVSEISEVKKVLGVRTYVDVGLRTFEYFYEAECGDE
jgi:hypothetical protein